MPPKQKKPIVKKEKPAAKKVTGKKAAPKKAATRTKTVKKETSTTAKTAVAGKKKSSTTSTNTNKAPKKPSPKRGRPRKITTNQPKTNEAATPTKQQRATRRGRPKGSSSKKKKPLFDRNAKHPRRRGRNDDDDDNEQQQEEKTITINNLLQVRKKPISSTSTSSGVNNNNSNNNNTQQQERTTTTTTVTTQQKPGPFDRMLTPQAVKLALQTAVANLRVGTTTPVGRQEQLAQVLNFITANHRSSLTAQQQQTQQQNFIISNVLQLFGMPGTGKTAIVKHALHVAQQQQRFSGGLSYVFLNGFLLEKPGELYCRLWQHLSKVRLGNEQLLVPDAAAVALEQRFRDKGWPAPSVIMNQNQSQQHANLSRTNNNNNTGTSSGVVTRRQLQIQQEQEQREKQQQKELLKQQKELNAVANSSSSWRCIIVIDEVDKLNENSAGWRAFFRLLEWLELSHCHCRLITMSNSMQLPDAAKTRSRVSTSSHQRVVFTPYQAEELRAILLDRVKDIVPKVFNDSAIDYICKQIASQNGDVRRMLQTTSVAIHEVLSLNSSSGGGTVASNGRGGGGANNSNFFGNNSSSYSNYQNSNNHNNNSSAMTGLPIPETRDSGIITLRQLHSTVRRVLHDRLPELFHEDLPDLTRLAICTLCLEAQRAQRDKMPMSLTSWRQSTATAMRRHGLKIRMNRIVSIASGALIAQSSNSFVTSAIGPYGLAQVVASANLSQQQNVSSSQQMMMMNNNENSTMNSNTNSDNIMLSQSQTQSQTSSDNKNTSKSFQMLFAAGAMRPVQKALDQNQFQFISSSFASSHPIVLKIPTPLQRERATEVFANGGRLPPVNTNNTSMQQQSQNNMNNNNNNQPVPLFPHSLQHLQQLQSFINTCTDEHILPDHDWYNVVATLRDVALIEVHVIALNQMTQNVSAYQLQQRGLLQQNLVPAGRTQWSMSFYSQPGRCTVTLLQNYETVKTLCELKFEEMKVVFE